MWQKAKWNEHVMRLELIRVGLLDELVNHYKQYMGYMHNPDDVFKYETHKLLGGFWDTNWSSNLGQTIKLSDSSKKKKKNKKKKTEKLPNGRLCRPDRP